MSLQMDTPLVCQIPGCTTTQAEIESELTTFLSSFCSVCKKERGGKLCSCAFPCSLTFKSQMLVKIHELLGIAKPPDRRAIQVMFLSILLNLRNLKSSGFVIHRFASSIQIY